MVPTRPPEPAEAPLTAAERRRAGGDLTGLLVRESCRAFSHVLNRIEKNALVLLHEISSSHNRCLKNVKFSSEHYKQPK